MKRLMTMAVLMAVAVMLATISGRPGGSIPAAEADTPEGCSSANVFSVGGTPKPAVVQPGETVTVQIVLENRDGFPCDWTGSIEIGRSGPNPTDLCQPDDALADVILSGYTVGSQERHVPPKLSGGTPPEVVNATLEQQCVIPPSATPGPFLIDVDGFGFIKGDPPLESNDDREVKVQVVRPRLTLVKTCIYPNNLVPPGADPAWNIVATNTSEGNVSLTNVNVTDNLLLLPPSPFDLPNPGDSQVLSHTKPKTDPDQRVHLNTATATADVVIPGGSPTPKTISATSNEKACINQARKPEIKKVPNLVNLWLCNIPGAPGCINKEHGVQEVNFDILLNGAVNGPEPKCVAKAVQQGTDPELCPRQSIGSFEFEVRYPSKYVKVTVERGELFRDERVQCVSLQKEHAVRFRCVTKGKTRVVYGPGVLATVRVRPTPDVYSILVANQLNGIMTQIINQDCQLSDLQGHPIKIADDPETDKTLCNDAAVTIRYLEGDVHADCEVNLHDQQQIAFRWASRLGNLLYNDRYDLEPSYPKKADGDIDAKDLQLVYGRHGSTCKFPHPPQPPVDPKAKVEPPINGG